MGPTSGSVCADLAVVSKCSPTVYVFLFYDRRHNRESSIELCVSAGQWQRRRKSTDFPSERPWSGDRRGSLYAVQPTVHVGGVHSCRMIRKVNIPRLRTAI